MALKVIGAGLGRTGTASLKQALETLAFGPCYHMFEVLADPSRTQHWLAAARGEAVWAEVFDGYHATVDFPACIYWKEILEAFPDAKVLLSTRDLDNWFASTQETIFSAPIMEENSGSPFAEMNRVTLGGFYGALLDDKEALINRHQRHVDSVIANVPTDQLLVYQVQQGWEPLCQFLGVPVPNQPFPHVNSRAETKAAIEAMRAARGDAEATAQAIASMKGEA